MKKVVLAFSGGLDTSFCAVYLQKEKNIQVHAVSINTGGFSNTEVQAMEQRALQLGVASYQCIDVTQQYYDTCVKYLIFGNVLKNNTYPLSVSSERTIQALHIAQYAQTIGANAIAHGSTGAGNDQVRFDGVFAIICPEIEIITPIRDLKLSREQEIEYLQKHNIKLTFNKGNYSINKGLWGTSVGGQETLQSRNYLPEEAFPSALQQQQPTPLEITFTQGQITQVNGTTYNHPSQAIIALNNIGQQYAIGRDIHVGDTIIGIKGRVGFEAAGAILSIKAHHHLEKHTLTKYQLTLKNQLADWYGNWLHEGLFLDPVMRDIEAFLQNTQQQVNGTVYLTLYPYRFIINGIQSNNDLMSAQFGQYGEMNNSWNGNDVKGFTKIYTNYLSIYNQINSIKI